MNFAFVLESDEPGPTDRLARGLARELREAGHVVDLFAVSDAGSLPFPGHPGEADRARPVEEAARAGASYDGAAAFGAAAFYGMFLLQAAARVHVDTGEAWRAPPAASTDAALVERSLRTPGVALVTTSDARRAVLSRDLGRDASVLPPFVDGAAFSSASVARSGGPTRVLIEGGGVARAEAARRAARIARRVEGVEVWCVGSDAVAGLEGIASRVLGAVPAVEMPPVLRACDVLFEPAADGLAGLTSLEAMACGLSVVAGDGLAGADVLRHEGNALIVDARDEDAAVAALARVTRDAGLRARLAAGARATAAAHDRSSLGPAAVEAFLRAVRSATPPPETTARELAAIGDLLRRVPRASLRPRETSNRSTRGRWWRRVRAASRDLVRRALSPARADARARDPARPASASAAAGPGEPVVFAGQPHYFRSAYADAVRAGWGVEHAVRPDERDGFERLPRVVETSGARTCVVFDPWLLAAHPAVAVALRAQGVRLVAYSTEPVPLTGDSKAHWDQLRRLDNLRRARDVAYDLWIHHDRSSEGFLRSEGFEPLVTHPLPVSEDLFHPEDVPCDFDVCFLGWSTPHREAFLSAIEGRCRTVHVAHGIFDEEACRLLNRSRLVLNLHAHDYRNFENRCVQALFCGRPLVSEELSGGYLTPGDDYLLARTPAEALAHTRDVLSRGDGAQPRPRFDRSRFLVASLRELLRGTRGTGPAA